MIIFNMNKYDIKIQTIYTDILIPEKDAFYGYNKWSHKLSWTREHSQDAKRYLRENPKKYLMNPVEVL